MVRLVESIIVHHGSYLNPSSKALVFLCVVLALNNVIVSRIVAQTAKNYCHTWVPLTAGAALPRL